MGYYTHSLHGRPFEDKRPLARPLFDFLSFSSLAALAIAHVVYLLTNVSLDASIITLIIVSTALNVLGVSIAVFFQRGVFTITFFFTLFFFSLAPMQQLVHHFDPVMEDPSILVRAFGFCLIFSASCFAAMLVMGPAKPEPLGSAAPPQPFSANACAMLLALLSVSILVGAVFFSGALFTDRATHLDLIQAEYAQPVVLLYTGFLQPLMIYGSVVGLWISWTHKHFAWCAAFCVTLLGGLILTNPMVTPRFEFATLIYAIFFYLAGRRHNRLLVLALLIGVATAPVFNFFRLNDGRFEYRDATDFLVDMDYDAFSLLCHTIWHVDYNGFDYGNNILSAIFFFVPRTIWPTKNEITPYYLMDSLTAFRGLWNSNLSEPLIAEGYFAFGILGVLAVTAIYIWFARFLELNARENRLTAIYLFCCAAPPLLFILLRGSLLVGISVIVGNIGAMWLAVTVATRPTEVRRIGARRLKRSSLSH